MAKILAVDLGTTFFKITLFDRNGRLSASCRIAPPVVVPRPGRMELSPDALVDVLARAVEDLRNRNGGDFSDVDAVTFATQTNSFVLLDADDVPLTPIVLWPDKRAAFLEAEIARRSDLPKFTATTGIPRINGQFMVSKLFWMREQASETWKRTAKICLISDYLTLLMTGLHITEAGASGLTGLLDIHDCLWWSAMTASLEIDERRLPTVVRAGTDLGPIAPRAAERFGLPRTCRFVVGCLDQYAGAIGAGNVAPEMTSETTGTVLATVQCTDRFSTEVGPTVFQGPAYRRGLYWRMVFGEVSANYLQWYRGQLPDRPEFEQLTALAEPVAPGADGLRLRTERGPIDLETVFGGTSARHTRGHRVRCIMEAVARALDDQIKALSGCTLPHDIRCAGGAARSALWLQIKADMLGVPTVATECPEPASLGAAILAEAALASADVSEVAQRWVRLKAPHVPDPQRHRRYASLVGDTHSP